MKQDKKHILTRNQWYGVALLCILLLIAGVLLYFLPRWIPTSMQESEVVLLQEKVNELDAQLQDLYAPKTFQPQPKTPIRLHPFDPNTADSLTLCEVGMPAWMARNVLRYRAKGGIYRHPDALRKVYGMNDSLFAQLKPYIAIDTTYFQHTDSIQQAKLDSLLPRTTYRTKRDTILDLNSADTTTLQLIRGIGSYSARQIVHYRQALGGFAHVEQLREVKGLTANIDSLLPFFYVNTDSIHPIPVNQSRVERLNRHPYLTFTQARALYEYRRMHLRLDSIAQLKMSPAFTADDIHRLTPYLSFE